VFEQLGYRQAGQKGSHLKLEKTGVARPLIVPKYSEAGLDIITNLIRTAGITRERSWRFCRAVELSLSAAPEKMRFSARYCLLLLA
jgi:predicted RNA binding protein YcfA (HicA-like mRNA interferase family)